MTSRKVKWTGYGRFMTRGGRALKDFCISEGLKNNNSNATNLRKYLTTITSSFEKEKRSQISDYMGHNFAIYENIYKKRSATQDILEIGPVLSFANGSTSNAKESSVDFSNLHSQHTYQNTPSTSTER
ncbi:hypothetical protein JTB14_028177 [Gonioctena quinquepunctata]|nr:hypothetical protein JTB14_028177 [Gonioctena quinquepunctata]